MAHISIRDLQKISGDAIGAPGPTPVDANLALSKARAQAVVDALTNGYKIDGKRLSASGVANFAPLASNASENGRARNRRVEMVLQ